MAKIEYLVGERKHRYSDEYSYYALGYGYSYSESSFLQTLGRDGWELVSSSGSTMRFKRVVEEDDPYDFQPESAGLQIPDPIDYSQQLGSIVHILSTGFLALDERLATLQKQQMILTGLLQSLAEKICPDAPFVQSLQAELAAASKEQAAPVTIAGETFAEDPKIAGFADEHMELIMKGYEEEDKSLNLFAVLVGFGFTLPLQTPKDHQRYMMKALYRYYEKHTDEKLAECYTAALQKASRYLSSPESIQQLNGATKASLTIAEAADTFFNIAITQLEFEKQSIAPFKVSQVADFVKAFVEHMLTEPTVLSDDALTAKIKAYLATLHQISQEKPQ